MAIKCSNCSTENPDDAHVCMECGASLGITRQVTASYPDRVKTLAPELPTGSTFAGRYQIMAELGQGGMGRVYRVLDTKINEEVALKLIRSDIAEDDVTLERFNNELKTARKISHRNVCRMFHLEEEGGTHYITMEYIQGVDLKSFIKRSGQLSVSKAVSITRQVCEGLQEAHRMGIVHRDLKPQNVIIDEEGNSRIMDFGIALSYKTERVTSQGMLIGTPEYMSPEQVEAKPVDGRSDIYNMGILIYEMLTGKLPFEGETPLSIAVKHLNQKPQNPQAYNMQIPDSLSQIILKCLEKNREKRYQTTRELCADLAKVEEELETGERKLPRTWAFTTKKFKHLTGLEHRPYLPAAFVIALAVLVFLSWRFLIPQADAMAVREPVDVAVISFVNQTGDPAFDYLQEAIPNLLITSLEQSDYIRVMTWERMQDLMRKAGKEGTRIVDRDLGFQLCRMDGIQAIVLGSFIKAENTFMTDVKVLDVDSKSILKSASTRGEGVASILRRQIDDLSREISKGVGLKGQKLRIKPVHVADMTTGSMEAYNNFLKGRENYEKYYYNDARDSLEKAVNLDPEFALAHYYLAMARRAQNDIIGMQESLQNFQKYGKDLKGKEGRYVNAMVIRTMNEEPEKYVQSLEKLIEEYPKEKRFHFDLGVYYQATGKIDEAISELEETLELDPKFGYALNQLAYIYGNQDDFEKAYNYFQEYANVAPNEANPHDSMGDLFLRVGKLDQAVERYKKAIEVKPDFGSEFKIAYTNALKEDYTEALRWIDQYNSMAPSDNIKILGGQWKSLYLYLTGQVKRAFSTLDESLGLARNLGNINMIDQTLRAKIWVAYDWNLMDEYSAVVDERLKFRSEHDMYSVKLSSTLPPYYYGIFDLKKGDINGARKKMDEIDSIYKQLEDPEKPLIKVAIVHLLSELLMAEGKYDKALDIHKGYKPSYEVFARVRDNLPYVYDFKARALAAWGELDKAIAEYETLIQIDPDARIKFIRNPFLYYRLGKLYEQKSLWVKAKEVYQKALAIWENADEDLSEVKEIRQRLAQLESVPPTPGG